jgi:hypothetical protein
VNYFAHAFRFLDDPYFVAGTAVPDWLSVADRPARVRSKHVQPFIDDPDAPTAAVAGGMRQHFHDDARFHESRAFVEVAFALTASARDALGNEAGLRPSFLGHLLTEVLLDWVLIEEAPAALDAYYRLLDRTDASRVQGIVNRMSPRPTQRLAAMIEAFRAARILSDYREDARLLGRLNQVMRRVNLPPLPDHFGGILPEARWRVAGRAGEMLA